MSINLKKDGIVSLTKAAAGLDRITIGLGWDPAATKKGLFGGMKKPDSIDLDASVILFAGSRQEIVYFGNKVGGNGAVRHSGDNLTGQGDGDDETIKVALGALPADVTDIAVTVNSFRGQTFNEVENAFCRVVDDKTGQEICRFDLAEKGGHTGTVMAILSRKSGEWTMKALGVPMNGRTAHDLAATAASLI